MTTIPGRWSRTTALSSVLLGGVLVLGATLPAAAQPAPGGAPTVQMPADSRASFSARAHNDLAEWGRRIDAFDQRASASGRRTTDAAGARLHTAWDKTKEAGRSVDSASAQDWNDAEASYETASHDLATEWDKIKH